MKRARYIKIAVLLSVVIISSASFVVNKPDEQIATLNLKASGNDYELPFIPVVHNHEWDNGTVTTPPTCTAPGVRTYTCKLNSNHTKTEKIPKTGHTPAEAVIENEIPATCTEDGSYDEVTYCSVCNAEISRNTVIVPALGPSEVELKFIEDEIIIVVPDGAIQNEYEFDVQKIIPPPQEFSQKVNEQTASSGLFSYYEIRLYGADETLITHLDGDITVKTKMPEQYIGKDWVHAVQQDETGRLITMNSWWENEYLCYNTDWLEIY